MFRRGWQRKNHHHKRALSFTFVHNRECENFSFGGGKKTIGSIFKVGVSQSWFCTAAAASVNVTSEVTEVATCDFRFLQPSLIERVVNENGENILVLGLEINSSSLGFSICNNEGKILRCGRVMYHKVSTNMFEQAMFVRKKLELLKSSFDNSALWVVGVECVPKHFGKISPLVVANLIKMNSLISYECYKLFDNLISANMSNVYTAFGIKKMKKKKSKDDDDDEEEFETGNWLLGNISDPNILLKSSKEMKEEKLPHVKEQAFNFIRDLLPNITWKLKSTGRYCDSNYDISEAAIMSLYTLQHYKKEVIYRQNYSTEYLPFKEQIYNTAKASILKKQKTIKKKLTKKQQQKIDEYVKKAFFKTKIEVHLRTKKNDDLYIFDYYDL